MTQMCRTLQTKLESQPELNEQLHFLLVNVQPTNPLFSPIIQACLISVKTAHASQDLKRLLNNGPLTTLLCVLLKNL